MSRRQQSPLRPLSATERRDLERLSRASSAPAAVVVRARVLLAVADGQSFTAAAQQVGRRSGDAVARLVAGFKREGVAAVEPGHGGGRRPTYGSAERERVLAEFRRVRSARRTARRPGP